VREVLTYIGEVLTYSGEVLTYSGEEYDRSSESIDPAVSRRRRGWRRCGVTRVVSASPS
jgi:hypothetical protein